MVNPFDVAYADEEEVEQQVQEPLEEKTNPFDLAYASNKTEERPKSQFAGGYFSPEERELKTPRENLQQIQGMKRGLYKGATFGLSEYIPDKYTKEKGFHKEELSEEAKKYEPAGEFLGSILPMEQTYNIFGRPLVEFAKKSPIFKKSLGALARIIGMGESGIAYTGIKQAAEGKVPSIDDMMEHGIEWALLDTALQTLGLGGRFAKSLLFKSKSTGKPPWELINEELTRLKGQGQDIATDPRVAAKALSEFNKPEPLQNFTEKGKPRAAAPVKISQKKPETGIEIPYQSAVNNLKSKTILPENLTIKAPELAEPVRPREVDVEHIEENLAKDLTDKRLEGISERAPDSKTLGENIKTDVENQLEAAKEEYRPFYEEAQTAAEDVVVPSKSIKNISNTVNEVLKKVQTTKTMPTGYQGVVKVLDDVLSDLGFQIERDPSGHLMLFPRVISGKATVEGTSLSKLMELKRRLNEIINWDVLEKDIKDKLKPVVAEVRKVIRESLPKDARAAWELAEEKFGKTAEKFGKDPIFKLRGEEATEKIADIIKSPSGIQDLRAVASPAQMAQVEREILEKIKEMNSKSAKDYYRQIKNVISPEAQSAADLIIHGKSPLNRRAIIKESQGALAQDLAEAFATGKRPNETLKMWRTPEGQNIIEGMLNGNPNKDRILDYLKDQSFYDVAKSVIKDGEINFENLNQFLKDPAFIKNLKMIGGEEAVTFFNNLEKTYNKLQRNLAPTELLIQQKPQVKKGVKAPEERVPVKGKEKLAREGTAREQKREELPTNKLKEVVEKGEETAKERSAYEKKYGKAKGKDILQKAAQKKKETMTSYKVEKALDKMGISGKAVMSLLAIKVGIPHASMAYFGPKILYSLAKTPEARKAYMKAVNASKVNPVAFLSYMETLGNIVDEEEVD